jgi:hypothetical protein
MPASSQIFTIPFNLLFYPSSPIGFHLPSLGRFIGFLLCIIIPHTAGVPPGMPPCAPPFPHFHILAIHLHSSSSHPLPPPHGAPSSPFPGIMGASFGEGRGAGGRRADGGPGPPPAESRRGGCLYHSVHSHPNGPLLHGSGLRGCGFEGRGLPPRCSWLPKAACGACRWGQPHSSLPFLPHSLLLVHPRTPHDPHTPAAGSVPGGAPLSGPFTDSHNNSRDIISVRC